MFCSLFCSVLAAELCREIEWYWYVIPYAKDEQKLQSIKYKNPQICSLHSLTQSSTPTLSSFYKGFTIKFDHFSTVGCSDYGFDIFLLTSNHPPTLNSALRTTFPSTSMANSSTTTRLQSSFQNAPHLHSSTLRATATRHKSSLVLRPASSTTALSYVKAASSSCQLTSPLLPFIRVGLPSTLPSSTTQ